MVFRKCAPNYRRSAVCKCKSIVHSIFHNSMLRSGFRLYLISPVFSCAMTATTLSTSSQVLADLFPRRDSRSRAVVQDVVMVVGFALLTAIAAQIEIPLGFTPVPLTGQTFAVLLSGAVLGMRRGALSQLVYWFAGLTGLPFYSGGAGGDGEADGSGRGGGHGTVASIAKRDIH